MKRSATAEVRYGSIRTEHRIYRPLDSVKVEIKGRTTGDRSCRIRVADPLQRVYFEQEVVLDGNRGTVSFAASGPLGTHYV